MDARGFVSYLFPRQEAEDASFAHEVERLSVAGLRVIAGVTVAFPVITLVVGILGLPEFLAYYGGTLAIMALGTVTFGLTFWASARRRARVLGIGVGFLVGLTQAIGILSSEMTSGAPSHLAGAYATFVLLVGMAALPLKPWHVFALAIALLGSYAGVARTLGVSAAFTGRGYALFMFMFVVGLMCTALTAVMYAQRASAFHARRAAELSFEELKRAQARLLVSENAASQGRFAAALSHELNTPLGSLGSAVDTFMRAYDRIVEDPSQLDDVQYVLRDAVRSVRESRDRLDDTIDRLKHLTNLDRAESMEVDLSELWAQTAALLRPEIEPKAELKLELEPLPPLRCRPQQMSAVFSNLLRNAAAAIGQKGTIRVSSNQRNGEVVLEVRDDGRGIPASELPRLFDPTFRVEGGRVATTNWGLFVSRSIVAEHGGQIEIESQEGEGTTARIVLPLMNQPPKNA